MITDFLVSGIYLILRVRGRESLLPAGTGPGQASARGGPGLQGEVLVYWGRPRSARGGPRRWWETSVCSGRWGEGGGVCGRMGALCTQMNTHHTQDPMWTRRQDPRFPCDGGDSAPDKPKATASGRENRLLRLAKETEAHGDHQKAGTPPRGAAVREEKDSTGSARSLHTRAPPAGQARGQRSESSPRRREQGQVPLRGQERRPERGDQHPV